MRKRFMTLALVIAMFVCCFPSNVFASADVSELLEGQAIEEAEDVVEEESVSADVAEDIAVDSAEESHVAAVDAEESADEAAVIDDTEEEAVVVDVPEEATEAAEEDSAVEVVEEQKEMQIIEEAEEQKEVQITEKTAPEVVKEVVEEQKPAKSTGGLLAANAYGWVKSGGKWYYYSTNQGQLRRGIYYINNDGANYAFWSDGSLVTGGWKRIDAQQSDGSYKKVWVYASSGGKLLSGWRKLSGKWYYFTPSCPAALQGGVYTIGGKDYYFDDSCAMRTGWIKGSNGYWYYANSSGALAGGWKKVGGKWYYFDTYYKTMFANGSKTIGGEKYYFAANGAMRTGWIKDGGEWYFAGTNGKLRKGWLNIKGSWYYLDTSAYSMLTGGIYTIGGKKYYFHTDSANLGIMYSGGPHIIVENGITYQCYFYSDGELYRVVKI